MQPATTSHVPIYLRLDSSVGFSGASPPNCTITISLSSSVDLGLVGRMLGLDPNTVCLNGYYVSCIGPHYVSPGLLWGPLLDFFAQRRLPSGSEIQDAIVVQGKYVGRTDVNLFLKRKARLGTECLLKKRKVTNYKSNGSAVHHIKRIVNSDDIQNSFMRMKIAYSSIGCTEIPHQYSCLKSCNDGMILTKCYATWPVEIRYYKL